MSIKEFDKKIESAKALKILSEVQAVITSSINISNSEEILLQTTDKKLGWHVLIPGKEYKIQINNANGDMFQLTPDNKLVYLKSRSLTQNQQIIEDMLGMSTIGGFFPTNTPTPGTSGAVTTPSLIK